MRRRLALLAATAALLGPSAGWANGAIQVLSHRTSVPDYVTGGAFVPADAYIGTNSDLNTTNSQKFYREFWVMGNYSTSAPASVLTNIHNANVYQSKASSHCEPPNAPGQCDSFDNTGTFNINDTTGTSPSTNALRLTGDGVQAHIFRLAQYNHYIVTGDIAVQHFAVVVNGVNQFGPQWVTGGSSTSMIPDLNGGGIHLINGGTNPVIQASGYISDLIATEQASFACTGVGAPATMSGITVTCLAADTVPQEIINKGINVAGATTGTAGAPVDPGPNCNKFGFIPEVCFKAGSIANTTGMTTNLGSATPAVAVASVAVVTGGAIGPAPFGPNGIPAHQATLRWAPMQDRAPVAIGGTGKSLVSNAYGNPISAGDFIMLVATLDYTGGPPTGAACPAVGANSWTTIGPMQDLAGNLASYIVCYTIAQSGDTGGAWTIAWTTTSGTVRSSNITMLDYVNVASVDQHGSLFNNPAVGSHLTASLTTTCANSTLISFWLNNQATDAGSPFTFPAGVNQRVRTVREGAYVQTMIGDEYGVALGANTQRTATRLSSGTDQSWGGSVNVCPT